MKLPENADSSPRSQGPPLQPISPIGVIDRLEYRDLAGEVVLVLVENQPWGASSDQSFILQEKLNAYLSFILDGEMLDAYPAFRNKSVRLVLECVKPPTGRMLEFLQLVHDQCALQGIQFMVDVIGKRCGCGEPLDRCEGKIKSGTEHLTQKDPAAPE